MSGFAAINGEPDGAPLLPPIALTDEVTALVAAFATMVAVHSGVGQVVDVNLLESLFQLMGPLVSAYGAARATSSPGSAPASPTPCPAAPTARADDRWVAVSTSAESVARRVLDLVGVGDDPRFHSLRRRGSSTAPSWTRWSAPGSAARTAGRGARRVRGRPTPPPPRS